MSINERKTLRLYDACAGGVTIRPCTAGVLRIQLRREHHPSPDDDPNETSTTPTSCFLLWIVIGHSLRRIGVKGVEIRKAEQLENVSSLIIPGGESTTMAKLAELHNLFPALREFVKMGKPVWGTCAGLIFLANKATGQKTGGQELVGGLDCTVHRNFFDLPVPELASQEGGPPSFRAVFIRAPAILEVGPGVEVLASVSIQSSKIGDFNSSLQEESAESDSKVIVAVKQGNILATAFHPELTIDSRWHTREA
ncbi:hypothetical protein E3N88_14835 [Mikania micrantha]|uniref:glutaminase n=1 Tax=Mikania micrantha TaxID=192012 RepID=A0A5N6LFN2_9ASTR|nr:hypothetical protein E3N88_43220 [Mikania micrantha]KAD5803475.1 hypothetical protein E3N88_14835 [Mikania micrantha]